MNRISGIGYISNQMYLPKKNNEDNKNNKKQNKQKKETGSISSLSFQDVLELAQKNDYSKK